MEILKKIFFLLNKRERKRWYLLLVMIMIMAFFDLLGVASVMPFITILTNPEIIESNNLIFNLYQFLKKFGIQSNEQFLFIVGLLVFLLLLFSLFFKALTIYAQMRFCHLREYSIGKRLIESYLQQPYSWFLSRNSSDLGKNILSEVNQVISNGIGPMMILIVHSAVTFAIMSLLIFVDYKLAISTFCTLGIAYGLIYNFNRSMLKKIGLLRVEANLSRFKTVSEAFGAIKALKVKGIEKIYVNRFSKPANRYSKYQASAVAIQVIPKYAIEAIAFGGIILVILYMIARGDSFDNAIPILALYAFAGYRLMPALQAIYGAITKLRFAGPSLDILHNHIKNFKNTNYQKNEIISFKHSISLKEVQYYYPKSQSPALDSINLDIQLGSVVGFIGSTGSGKTTAIDIILGLLEPSDGNLMVDNKIINFNNKRSWQNKIGYVPQLIYLTDDAILSNIAFGLETNFIDVKAVEEASRIANINEFINNQLPDKYQTRVGEGGVRLSGGQRQRIGIARALYNKPDVLILDEATSALDNDTESEVMRALHEIDRNLTIIMVAHRLSTLKKCDKIFIFDDGKVVDSGSYNDLLVRNKDFKSQVNKI